MFQKKRLLFVIGKHIAKALGAIILALTITFFMARQISNIGDSLAEKRRLAYAIERRQEVASGLRQAFKIVGENDAQIERALPPADDILDFVTLLESLARERSIEQTYKFGTPASIGSSDQGVSLVSIDYTLTLRTNVSNLLAYLKRLEKVSYFTAISSLAINNQGSFGLEGDSSVQVQAQLYGRQIK